MTKDELLMTKFDSACDAMYALADFLSEVDQSHENESRGAYQNLHAVGNQIFE